MVIGTLSRYRCLTSKCINSRLFSLINVYEIPEKYRDTFYLANATLLDNTNWFIHRGYEVVFNQLVEDLRAKNAAYDKNQAKRKILNCIKTLDVCNNFIDVNISVKKENGVEQIVRGYRAHHGLNLRNLPCLGGFRLCSDLEKDDVRGLATNSTYRYAGIGIFMAGSHGGINICPSEFTQNELKSIIQNYARKLYEKKFCGENVDVLKPDFHTTSEHIDWIADSYRDTSGEHDINRCVVGKSVSCGGLENYDKTTGQGVYFGLDWFLQNDSIMEEVELEKGWKNKTFVTQGFGKVGSHTAYYMEQAGAKCVGIMESNVSLYQQDGINVQEAIAYKNKNGTLLHFADLIKPYKNDEVLSEKCDILVLAANHRTMSCYLADKIKAKIIVEAANGAVTPSAQKIFLSRKRLVLPDIYVNCGSSIAGYFEYLKNLKNSGYTEQMYKSPTANALQVVLNCLDSSKKTSALLRNTGSFLSATNKISCISEKDAIIGALDQIITQTAKDVVSVAEKFDLGLDIRTAAYVNSIQNIFKNIQH